MKPRLSDLLGWSKIKIIEVQTLNGEHCSSSILKEVTACLIVEAALEETRNGGILALHTFGGDAEALNSTTHSSRKGSCRAVLERCWQ